LGAPCQLVVLAGPEHGRTIPLADMSGSPSLLRKLAIEAHSTAARIFLL
jgi:hypothetical protein